MERGRFPRPYQDTVKLDENLMQYTSFPTMGIGARRSGLPKDASEGPKSIDHVGGTTSGGDRR